jgi:predicted GIY-YIG superfamily endonuclease
MCQNAGMQQQKQKPIQANVCYLLTNDTSLSTRGAQNTYIGSTNNFVRRLRQHQGQLKGGARATRKGAYGFYPLVCVEGFMTIRLARRFESLWKKFRDMSQKKAWESCGFKPSPRLWEEVQKRYLELTPETDLDSYDLTTPQCVLNVPSGNASGSGSGPCFSQEASGNQAEILSYLDQFWVRRKRKQKQKQKQKESQEEAETKSKAKEEKASSPDTGILFSRIDRAIHRMLVCLGSRDWKEICAQEFEQESGVSGVSGSGGADLTLGGIRLRWFVGENREEWRERQRFWESASASVVGVRLRHSVCAGHSLDQISRIYQSPNLGKRKSQKPKSKNSKTKNKKTKTMKSNLEAVKISSHNSL